MAFSSFSFSFLLDNFDTLNGINSEKYQILEHIRENYYSRATLLSHIDYINKVYLFFKRNNRYPNKREFFLLFKNYCFCQYYINDEEVYLRAAEFFMKNTGDVITMSCSDVYYFNEFYTIERRDPINLIELRTYISRTALASIIPPDIFFQTEIKESPVEDSKIKKLKDKIFTFTYTYQGDKKETENCSICQDEIKDNQKCIRLCCGHYFHAGDDSTECCENGNIFEWFKRNDSCPLCRSKV